MSSNTSQESVLMRKWFPLASCVAALTVSFMAFQNFSFTLNDDSALFFQSDADGRVGYWSMDGNVLKHAGIMADKTGLGEWRLASVVDMNGDGYQDLIFQNNSNGRLMYWLMHGTTKLSEHVLNEEPGQNQLVSVADLNRDGVMDFVFQDRASGQVTYWLMNGAGVMASGVVPNGAGYLLKDTRLALITDLNGDGYADFVWQRRSNGAVLYTLMRGLTVLSSGDISADASPDLQLSAATDLNNDGKADFVFLKTSDHSTVLWLMDGVERNGKDYVNGSKASVGDEWRLVAASGK